MKRLLSACLLALSSLAVPAQNTGIGAYSFASFDNRGFDSVNLGNLNVRFSIPIINRQGRGLPFNYALQYEGLIWAPVTNSSTGTTSWVNDPAWGFTGVLNGTAFSGYLTYTSGYYMCSDSDDPHPAHTAYDSNYVYHDRFGASHPFNYTYRGYCPKTITEPSSPAVTTGDGSSSDGSGYRLLNGYQVVAQNGVVITPGQSPTGQDATNQTDTNGNQILKSTGGVFTDTLGQTALTVSGSSTVSFAYPVTLQSDNATTESASLSYRSYTVRTNFQCSNITEYGSNTVNLVDKLTLADGSFYQFTYEPTLSATDGAVTGRLASVTLPTGGTISYTYSGGCSSAGAGMNTDGSVGALTRTTSDGTRTYNRSPITNGSITTLTDEKNNQTQVSFVASAGSMYETHRQVYQGNATGSSLLNRYNCYNGTATPCDSQAITLPINEVDVTTSYNNGTQDLVKTQYISQTTLPTSVAQYASASGTLLQTTTTSYNGIGEPLGVTVTDGSNNTVSSSTFTYDGGSPTATSGLPQHVAATGTRGNLTLTQVSTGSGTLSTSATYYDTGAVQTSTAANGGQTTYGYDSTQAFVTQTTLPTPSSGVSLSTSATYDTTSTMPLISTGMNSETTSITGYDRLLRPTSASLPSGSSISYTYSSPNVTEVRQTLDGSQGHTDNYVQTDGYGRTIETAQYNGQASNSYYLVDYCYDATGLLKFQSTPYAWSGFNATKTCSGNGTAYQYDALGRVTAVTTPDGTANTTYSNRAVQTADVNGVTRVQQYDLLGRLSGICEVSSHNLADQSPVACGFDIGATGYLTSYGYDMANHKTAVTQGVQTRIFQTDAAGRTVSVTEPERGATSYSYTYNSVGLSVARTRPKQNQTNPSVTTTTTTQYDLLGRVASVGYNDGLTPSKNYYYDVSVGSSQGWSATPTNVKGRLVNYTSGSGSSLARGMLSYDVSGDVLTMWQCAPSICGTASQASRGTIGFSYDLAGLLTNETETVVGAIVYGRSVVGGITSITNQTYTTQASIPNLVSNVVSGPFGPTNWTWGNGNTAVQNFDAPTGRLFGRWLCQGNAGTGSNAACTSNSAEMYGSVASVKGSQVTGMCDDVLGCAGNGYDEFNRLTSISGNGNLNFTYTYDRYGNRLQQTGSPSTSFAYNYTTNQNRSFTYDAAGNQTNDGYHSYTYDAEGNVVQVDGGSTGQYVYDAFNRRVSQGGSSGTNEYVYDSFGHRISSWLLALNAPGGQGIEGRVYWDNTLIANLSRNGQTYLHHIDWLGTERMRTDYQGNETRIVSYAYGDGFSTSSSDGAGAAQDNNYFAGQEYDGESGTDHAQFRQYAPTQGRWQSPDPYDGSYDVGNPQSLNRYAYVLNNPLTNADPDGEDFSQGMCYYTASNCGAGGGGGGYGGGGFGLAALESYAAFTANSPASLTSYASETGFGETVAISPEEATEVSFNPGQNISVLSDGTISCGGAFCGNLTFSGGGYIALGSLSPTGGGPASGSGGGSIGPSSTFKMQMQRIVPIVNKVLCGISPGAKVFGSLRFGAGLGLVRGAASGFVGGEIAEPVGGGIPGALLGGFLGGVAGGAGGLLKGSIQAVACSIGGAYDGG